MSATRWPTPAEYHEAIQSLATSATDEELRGGEVALNDLGLPLLYSGGFADVYRVYCPRTDHTWAVKCFTRGATGLQERYQALSESLQRLQLPFLLDFRFLAEGLRIGDACYPIVKMPWVEGRNLNQYVEDIVDQPRMLDQLFTLWTKLAARLDQAGIAHADLQHGNVVLIPHGDQGQLQLRLIDYDGMFVPALAGRPSGELGLAAYQHPDRARQQIYAREVDRFSHLTIVTAIRALRTGGRSLWQRFNNGENLLFREADFLAPGTTPLFRELLSLRDAEIRALVGHLIRACRRPLAETPTLSSLLDQGRIRSLSAAEETELRTIVGNSAIGVAPGAGAAPPSRPIPLAATSPPPPSAALGAEPTPASPLLPEPFVSVDPVRRVPRRQDSPLMRSALIAGLASVAGFALAAVVFGGRGGASTQTGRTVAPGERPAAEVAGDAPIPEGTASSRNSVDEFRLDVSELNAAFKSRDYQAAKGALAVLERDTNSQLDAWRYRIRTMASRPPSVDNLPAPLVSSVGLRLRRIPAGEFTMGSANGQPEERPPHRVRISHDFFMGEHEVTQAQFEQVMGRNPSTSPGPNLPVASVMALEAEIFCQRLTKLDRAAGRLALDVEYRLPTEAEWEYAARAGHSGDWPLDSGLNLSDVAWYEATSAGGVRSVGTLQANRWGLHDVVGNVGEWVLDGFRADVYTEREGAVDPKFPRRDAVERIWRGAGFQHTAESCRVAARHRSGHATRSQEIGFRVIVAPVSEPPFVPEHFVNSDQRAAAWVLSRCGTLAIATAEGERDIQEKRELPNGDFKIVRIHFDHARAALDSRELEYVKDLRSIREIHFWGTPVADEDAKFLKDLTSLEVLGLGGSQLRAAGLTHLRGLTRVHNLHLGFIDTLNDDDLKALAVFSAVDQLCLSNSAVTGKGAHHLTAMKELRALDLWASQFGDEGMAVLPHFVKLESINLGGTKVSDKGFVHLRALNKLKTLDVQNTGFTDASMPHLVALKELEVVGLANTKLTDQGLKQLAQLPNLREVNVSGTQVTAVGKAEFRRMRPNSTLHE